jgi:fumarate hydratase subunit beta
MMQPHHLQLPVDEAAVRSLHVGDLVTLTGDIIVTAGLPTHERILDYLDRGEELPMDLRGSTLLHLGSYSQDVGDGLEILYMNPTTSTRFNPYMPRFIRDLGLRIVGGKGGLDSASADAMREAGCIYLSFLGGGATLHTAAIRRVVGVAWPDLIAHFRLTKLQVEKLGPLTVAIDAHGNSVYDRLRQNAEERMPEILRELDTERASVTKTDA